MTARCVCFFVRGMLFLGPAPYHGDYRCWSNGQETTVVGFVVSVLTAILVGAFWLGRMTV